ncbi:hypothetical protein GOBAR_AA09132 [Gossypium barbadense]|uniref:Uncharacterized protein n=1 Tax=Gossypium barbadense TaxID=3634 RepID=A0A2P5Y7D2_GOSBA|nr:hypothetical protein GOBAR_AA09132 [Gossypium barbadense]
MDVQKRINDHNALLPSLSANSTFTSALLQNGACLLKFSFKLEIICSTAADNDLPIQLLPTHPHPTDAILVGFNPPNGFNVVWAATDQGRHLTDTFQTQSQILMRIPTHLWPRRAYSTRSIAIIWLPTIDTRAPTYVYYRGAA